MDTPHPPAEVDVDAALVERLIADQHPDLAAGRVALADEGWDNFTYRLGAEHAVRLPRRQKSVALLEHEQQWLPTIAAWLPIRVPAPIALGIPSADFPWPWSVVPWLEGVTADQSPLPPEDGPRLARILRALHRPSPEQAPTNPYRGGPLAERRTVVEERMERLDISELEASWNRGLEADRCAEPVWIHGDLHPRNVLVREGRLTALIDWGDMAAGDPATDLACAWMLFDRVGRARFRAEYAPTRAEWCRARAWAVNFSTALIDIGGSVHAPMGETTLLQLREGEDVS